MSDASRQERAFLRYLYQDDPDTLARETAALQRQMDADFWSEWWCTSKNAKCNRLIAMEAERHFRADPRLTLEEHTEGLGALLFASERAVDDDEEYERLLAKIPHIDSYLNTWYVTVDRLHQAFPELSFAAGRADVIQEFLSPARHSGVPFAGGTPPAANGPNALTALGEYKRQVAQEPRRVPRDGGEASNQDEERREANNLWLSWLAYTKVLNEKYPRVLDEALTDAGVLAPRGTDKDQDGRPVLVRIR